jgi:hypothetical protein
MNRADCAALVAVVALSVCTGLECGASQDVEKSEIATLSSEMRLSSWLEMKGGVLMREVIDGPLGPCLYFLEWIRVPRPETSAFNPTEEDLLSVSKGEKGYEVFQLTEQSLTTPGQRRVVWVGYLGLGGVGSSGVLSAAVIESRQQDQLLVVLSEPMRRGEVRLVVFSVDLKSTISAAPLSLNPRRQDLWPPEPRPLASLTTEFSAPDLPRLTRIEALVAGSYLLVTGFFEAVAEVPLAFRLDLDTLEWSQLNWRRRGKG